MAGHAVVVPYPARGHVNPMMQLATKLASHGISVTFVLTESWHKIMTKAMDNDFSHAQKLGLDIRAAIIPDCVVGESERWGNMTNFFLSLSNMETHVSELITNLKSSGTAPSCIVADTFLRWAVPLAKRHNLLSIALWPMSVTTFSIFYHIDLVGLQVCIDCIPGVPSIQRAELPHEILSASPLSNEIAKCLMDVREANWVVGNSFYDLDCSAVEAMINRTPVQCVGPLLIMPSQAHCHDGKDDSQCSQWLDSKPARSVIYVSFGSFIQVSRAQVREIAMGLMQSRCYFVWALRPDKEASHVSEMLPTGFLETSKEQGLVSSWFNQVDILKHPSVGGFFSHCGWNAVMESISAGVPILGFPLALDQFVNCKRVVEEWKFGMRVRSREDENRVIAAQEISKRVVVFMEGEENVRFRGAVERLKELAREEVINGGSATNLKLISDRLKAPQCP
ncbi:hypothetical protein SUGI_0373070 [Cryptomeria japonica]|uniref:UDP-glycosyltransferase 86A1 n=1 Tax=Cryptomeria japonica TaxID=3369 RepID=UPI002408C6FA|nr:UDP-glycosyltransferase 86A1 [Cryptomeria japonica]GLJ20498.1 hypothetical protein SUGI_0373070 [Cryptomeria japonica]